MLCEGCTVNSWRTGTDLQETNVTVMFHTHACEGSSQLTQLHVNISGNPAGLLSEVCLMERTEMVFGVNGHTT